MNYKQIYDNIINYRLDNPLNGYTEKHHILPRSLGGNDDKSNLVKLSSREHYICHLLLTKIYPKCSQEYYKMVKAYNMMSKVKSDNQQRDYKINSKLYETLRLELSKALSISQSGRGNSQYKSFWVYNPSTLECKKVPSDFIIEDGWFKGRVTNWNKYNIDKYCIICKKDIDKSKNVKYCSKICKAKRYIKEYDINIVKHDIPSKNYNNGKKCVCNGKQYISVYDAARKLNINHETLRNRIKSNSNRFDDYYYIN